MKTCTKLIVQSSWKLFKLCWKGELFRKGWERFLELSLWGGCQQRRGWSAPLKSTATDVEESSTTTQKGREYKTNREIFQWSAHTWEDYTICKRIHTHVVLGENP